MSVLRPATASKTMSPPLPPSPPSGPPNSMNFSRRKMTAPAPPAPERTKIFAWSRKCMDGGYAMERRRGTFASPRTASASVGLCLRMVRDQDQGSPLHPPGVELREEVHAQHVQLAQNGSGDDAQVPRDDIAGAKLIDR